MNMSRRVKGVMAASAALMMLTAVAAFIFTVALMPTGDTPTTPVLASPLPRHAWFTQEAWNLSDIREMDVAWNCYSHDERIRGSPELRVTTPSTGDTSWSWVPAGNHTLFQGEARASYGPGEDVLESRAILEIRTYKFYVSHQWNGTKVELIITFNYYMNFTLQADAEELSEGSCVVGAWVRVYIRQRQNYWPRELIGNWTFSVTEYQFEVLAGEEPESRGWRAQGSWTKRIVTRDCATVIECVIEISLEARIDVPEGASGHAMAVAAVEGDVWDIKVTAVADNAPRWPEVLGVREGPLRRHDARVDACGKAIHWIGRSLDVSSSWDDVRLRFFAGAPTWEPPYIDVTIPNQEHTFFVSTGYVRFEDYNYIKRLRVGLGLDHRDVAIVAEIMEPVEDGVALATVWPDGAEPFNVSLSFAHRGYAVALIEDTPIPCAATVRVLDEGGNPVANATVTAYDMKDPGANSTAVTDEHGYATLHLPHQGIYCFYATSPEGFGFNWHIIVPLVSVYFAGPSPDGRGAGGGMAVGYRATGWPNAPPINYVEIKLGCVASLTVESYVIMAEDFLRLVNVSVPVTVANQSGVVAVGQTPLVAHLPENGTYYVSVPEAVVVNGTTYRFAFWSYSDGPVFEATTSVNVGNDRHVVAYYTDGVLLNITTAVEGDFEIGDFGACVLDLSEWRLVPSPYGASDGLLVPRVAWVGTAPCVAVLPKGEYAVAIYRPLEGYAFSRWLGAEGTMPGLYPYNYSDWALVNLTADKSLTSLHTLLEGAAPVLMVGSRDVDGSELAFVPLNITAGDGTLLLSAETPLRTSQLRGVLKISIAPLLCGRRSLLMWLNVDSASGHEALVNLTYGRLVWAVYTHTTNLPGVPSPGEGQSQAGEVATHSGIGLYLACPSTTRLSREF